nr:uncharacterized protein LOC129267274 [Lytechinus pictus]
MSYDLRKSQKSIKSAKQAQTGPPSKSTYKRPNPFSPKTLADQPAVDPLSSPSSESLSRSNPAKPVAMAPPDSVAQPDHLIHDEYMPSKYESFLTKKFEGMLEKAVDRLAKKIEAVESLLGASVEYERQRVNALQDHQQRLEAKLQVLEQEVSKLRADAVKNEAAVNKSERFSRRNNIRIVGIDETEPTSRSDDIGATSQPQQSENCIAIVEDKLRSLFGISSKVERAHRDGKKVSGKPRHILVKLLSYRDKVEVMKKARDVLKKEKFFIIDDLTSADLHEKRKWAKQVQSLYTQGVRMRFYAGKWRLRGGDAYNFEETSRDTSHHVGHDSFSLASGYA